MLQEIKERESVKNVDPFQLLLEDVRSYPLLEPEEEKLLSREYVIGKKCKLELNKCLEQRLLPIDEFLLVSIQIGIDAREKLINSNLKLVMSSAYYFSGSDDKNQKIEDDVIHNYFSGCEGLIKAVEKFDPERGNKLSTYASFKIVKAITENLRWKNIYAPRWIRILTKKYIKASADYMIINGKEPSDDYLLEKMDITQERLDTIRAAYTANIGVSLDKINEDEDDSKTDHLSPESYYSNFYEDYYGLSRPTESGALDEVLLSELNIQILRALKSSMNTEVKVKIVTHMFILGETNESKIARGCNVTPQYVSAERMRLLKILQNDPEFISFCLDYLGVRDNSENNNDKNSTD